MRTTVAICGALFGMHGGQLRHRAYAAAMDRHAGIFAFRGGREHVATGACTRAARARLRARTGARPAAFRILGDPAGAGCVRRCLRVGRHRCRRGRPYSRLCGTFRLHGSPRCTLRQRHCAWQHSIRLSTRRIGRPISSPYFARVVCGKRSPPLFYLLLLLWGGMTLGIYSIGLTMLGQRFQGEILPSANAGFILLHPPLLPWPADRPCRRRRSARCLEPAWARAGRNLSLIPRLARGIGARSETEVYFPHFCLKILLGIGSLLLRRAFFM
jgi:hypothetical protein